MLTNGTPAMVIRQDRLAAEARTVVFNEDAAQVLGALQPETMRFNQARPVPFSVPFGRCIFLDTTFMPGTIVFEVFGHTVELMPKALIIDNQPREWNSGFREIEARSLK